MLTRDPFRIRSGRTSVLRTAIHALAKRFDRVDCFIFENSSGDSSSIEAGSGGAPENCQRKYVGGPGLVGSPFGKGTRLVRGNALNEILFYESKIHDRLRQGFSADSQVVYCDSLRLAQYAKTLGRPWILDLDDLLSTRFQQFAGNDSMDVGQVLGHFGNFVPRPMKFVLALGLKHILKWESGRLLRREKYWAAQADEVSLVSELEAGEFAKSALRSIHSLPMSVPDVIQGSQWHGEAWRQGTTLRAVFVGYLAYQPNMEAITYLAEEAIPYLRTQGVDLQVSVVGSTDGIEIPESVGQCSGICMRGFVDDLEEEFDSHHFFVAPIFTGTGVKTKVLEAMRYGIPVVGTPLALSGLSLGESIDWSGTRHRRLAAAWID